MRKLTINARIATTIAFLGVLLIATGALGIFGMAKSNQAQRDGYEVNFASVVALGRSGTAMSRARFGLDWAMSNPHSPQLGEQLNRAKRLLGDADKAWAEFRALPKTPELQKPHRRSRRQTHGRPARRHRPVDSGDRQRRHELDGREPRESSDRPVLGDEYEPGRAGKVSRRRRPGRRRPFFRNVPDAADDVHREHRRRAG